MDRSLQAQHTFLLRGSIELNSFQVDAVGTLEIFGDECVRPLYFAGGDDWRERGSRNRVNS